MTKICSYDVNKHPAFKAVQTAVFDSFVSRLGLSSIEQIDQIDYSNEKHPGCDLRDDVELCNFLDNQMRVILSDLGHVYDFIQFPVNIRMLSPLVNKEYTQKEYNVDTVHCDHWSGSPSDSTNVYLYLRTNSSSPELAFYSVAADQQVLIDSYSGKYSNAPKVEYKRVDITSNLGKMHIFSCRVPHKILRKSRGVTISIDFRLRNKTAVFGEDLTCKSKEEWISSRITSLGAYWKWLNRYPSSFSEKIRMELEESHYFSDKYRCMRVDFIDRHYR